MNHIPHNPITSQNHHQPAHLIFVGFKCSMFSKRFMYSDFGLLKVIGSWECYTNQWINTMKRAELNVWLDGWDWSEEMPLWLWPGRVCSLSKILTSLSLLSAHYDMSSFPLPVPSIMLFLPRGSSSMYLTHWNWESKYISPSLNYVLIILFQG